MGSFGWLVVIALALTANGAVAADTGGFILTPHAGYTSLRVDHTRVRDDRTIREDQAMIGLDLGYRFRAGLTIEVGFAGVPVESIGDWFDEAGVWQYVGAVGYQIEFGDGWRFVPKIGYSRWEIESTFGRELLDANGVRHQTLHGGDVYYDVTLMKHLHNRLSLGLNFRDLDTGFASARQLSLVMSFDL